ERRKRPVRRNISPGLVVPGEHRPEIGGVFGPQFFDAAIAALHCHRAGTRRGRRGNRQTDWLAGFRIGHGSRHQLSFLRSSLKNLFSSGLLTRPAKPSNLPSWAISVAVLMNACMATRASEPPTLMRRTPIPAMSPTVKPNALLLRKFTGFGATAFTTASICS